MKIDIVELGKLEIEEDTESGASCYKFAKLIVELENFSFSCSLELDEKGVSIGDCVNIHPKQIEEFKTKVLTGENGCNLVFSSNIYGGSGESFVFNSLIFKNNELFLRTNDEQNYMIEYKINDKNHFINCFCIKMREFVDNFLSECKSNLSQNSYNIIYSAYN